MPRSAIVVAVSMIKDKVCAVTGAGSGIGRALAIELGRRGARAVAISDVNETGLGATAAAVQATGAGIHRSRLDVSDRDAMLAWAAELAQQFHVVHQICNNAGIADAGTIEEFGFDAYRRVLDINLWGVIHGTKAFLPYLIASGTAMWSTSRASTASWLRPSSAPTARRSSPSAASPRPWRSSWHRLGAR